MVAELDHQCAAECRCTSCRETRLLGVKGQALTMVATAFEYRLMMCFEKDLRSWECSSYCEISAREADTRWLMMDMRYSPKTLSGSSEGSRLC